MAKLAFPGLVGSREYSGSGFFDVKINKGDITTEEIKRELKMLKLCVNLEYSKKSRSVILNEIEKRKGLLKNSRGA